MKLMEMMDFYPEQLVINDPLKLPLSDNSKITEIGYQANRFNPPPSEPYID
jgi:hypothetical protein